MYSAPIVSGCLSFAWSMAALVTHDPVPVPPFPLFLASLKKTPHLVHVCVLPSATIGCASLSSDPVSRRLISFQMFDFAANLVGEFPRVLYFYPHPTAWFRLRLRHRPLLLAWSRRRRVSREASLSERPLKATRRYSAIYI